MCLAGCGINGEAVRVQSVASKEAGEYVSKEQKPKGLMPKHWIKLVIPKTVPNIAPAAGPMATAPTATGTTINVISNPKV